MEIGDDLAAEVHDAGDANEIDDYLHAYYGSLATALHERQINLRPSANFQVHQVGPPALVCSSFLAVISAISPWPVSAAR
jgi:hypothetical protein